MKTFPKTENDTTSMVLDSVTENIIEYRRPFTPANLNHFQEKLVTRSNYLPDRVARAINYLNDKISVAIYDVTCKQIQWNDGVIKLYTATSSWEEYLNTAEINDVVEYFQRHGYTITRLKNENYSISWQSQAEILPEFPTAKQSKLDKQVKMYGIHEEQELPDNWFVQCIDSIKSSIRYDTDNKVSWYSSYRQYADDYEQKKKLLHEEKEKRFLTGDPMSYDDEKRYEKNNDFYKDINILRKADRSKVIKFLKDKGYKVSLEGYSLSDEDGDSPTYNITY